MRRQRHVVTLTPDLAALIGVEASRTGDPLSACIRRAIAGYYEGHKRSPEYPIELSLAKRLYGDAGE